MDEPKLKTLLKRDLREAQTLCERLINEIEQIDLVDVDDQLAKITRSLTTAKLRLTSYDGY